MFISFNITCIVLDVNECSSSPCDANARCSNTVGSFECECNVGYTGDGMSLVVKLFCALNAYS